MSVDNFEIENNIDINKGPFFFVLNSSLTDNLKFTQNKIITAVCVSGFLH